MMRIGVLASLLAASMASADPAVDELLRSARAALKQGKGDEALELASQAIAKDAKSAEAYFTRGTIYEAGHGHRQAVADFTRAIALDPRHAEAYNHRGSEAFKLGQIEESIKDFDKFLELRPDETPGHWKRGISYYYVGRFDDGRKQFEGYEKVDTNDVENAVWHFLCAARKDGVDKARAGLLKIGKDNRIPMMEVYALFASKAKPEDVLTAASAGSPNEREWKQRLFYAHLYLGLYYEVMGDKEKTLKHMTEAAEKYRIGHYMGDVARVHLERLKK